MEDNTRQTLLAHVNRALGVIETGLVGDVPKNDLMQVYRDLLNVKTKLVAVAYNGTAEPQRGR